MIDKQVEMVAEEKRSGLQPSTELLLAELTALRNHVVQLERENARLRLDDKTGVLRSGLIKDTFKDIFRAVAEQKIPVTVAMADIDNFKSLQDQRSHIWGDTAISIAAIAIECQLRPSDLLFRFGGDEFLIIFPGVPLKNAEDVRTRIEKSLEDLEVIENGHRAKISLTIGMASSNNPPFDGLIELADRDLYAKKQAKKAGR